MEFVAKLVAKLLIRAYQLVVSPALALLFNSQCRFYPSCSNYALLCLEKHGIDVAVGKVLQRLLKCHPLCEGGVDLP